MQHGAASGDAAGCRPGDEALRIELAAALTDIRARIRGHAGDVVVASVKDGVVRLDFQGACRGCPAQGFTFLAVVEPALLAVPGVRHVQPPRATQSPRVKRRIQQMLEASRNRRETLGATP